MSCRDEFPEVEEGENNDNFAFDFTKAFTKEGVTLSSAVWTSEPSGLTFGSQSDTSYVSTVNIDWSSASAGSTYIIKCYYTKSSGAKRTKRARFRVKSKKEIC